MATFEVLDTIARLIVWDHHIGKLEALPHPST